MTKEVIENISSNIIGDYSPYDPEFPIAVLEYGLTEQNKRADVAIGKVYNNVVKYAPEGEQVKAAFKKGFRLVVDASDEILDDLEKGNIKLTTENNGKTYAQIRLKNGHYGKKLPIKEECFAKGVDSVQMANAFQMRAIQNGLEEAKNQLTSINGMVEEVKIGQRNDRIAHYISGATLFLEANNISDTELRKQLIASAEKELSLSSAQLRLEIEADIKYLDNKEYKKEKGNQAKKIDEKMRNIEEDFKIANQSYVLRSAIYCNEGELSAMANVMNQHSDFIDNTIAKNASLLIECDVRDDGTETGIWKNRENLKFDTSEIVQRINSKEKVVYLCGKEDADEE